MSHLTEKLEESTTEVERGYTEKEIFGDAINDLKVKEDSDFSDKWINDLFKQNEKIRKLAEKNFVGVATDLYGGVEKAEEALARILNCYLAETK